MPTIRLIQRSIRALIALFLTMSMAQATQLSDAPLVTTSNTVVKPNLMFIFDDSGSMAWTHMPDDVRNFRGDYGYVSSQCNGVYYNPSITYKAPLKYDGTSYPNSSFTSAWKDGFDTSAGTVDLSSNFYAWDATTSNGSSSDTAQAAYYYKYVGTQTAASQKDIENTEGVFYQECNTGITSGPVAKITVGSGNSTSVSSIRVNGTQILTGGATSSSSTSDTVASRIANNIGATGYSATSSGNVVTITGPASAAGAEVVVSVASGSKSFTTTKFTPFYKVTVSATSGPAGTDERTNFANWFSYYRTRLLMMKTSTGHAFKNIGNKYRVGFMTLNNNQGSGHDFLNIDTFESDGASSHKALWYAELYGASALNGTPLRKALSRAGKIYAKKITTIFGVTVSDPVQYSCQQNFTILSTDGYWNGDGGSKLDGSNMDNQDGQEIRPYLDGTLTTYAKRTSQLLKKRSKFEQSTFRNEKQETQLKVSTSNLQKQTTQLQERTQTLQREIRQIQQQTSHLQRQYRYLQRATSTLQTRSGTLQKRTSSNSGQNWTSWSNVGNNQSCTPQSVGTNRTECQYNWGSWVNDTNQCVKNYSSGTGTWTIRSGTDCQYTEWSSYQNVSSCSARSQNYSNTTAVDCQTISEPWLDVSSCSQDTSPNGSGQTVYCRYSDWTDWEDVGSCSTVNQGSAALARQCQTVTKAIDNVASCTVSNTPNANGQTFRCAYSAWTAWSGVPSCSAVAASSGPTNYSVPTARECRMQITAAYSNASTCNVTTVPNSGGETTQCQYTSWSSPVNAATCTNVAQSSGPSYTVGQAKQCSEVQSAWTGVSSCTRIAVEDRAGQNGLSRECREIRTGPEAVAACSNSSATSGNNWTQTNCNEIVFDAEAPVASCTAITPNSSNGYVGTYCRTVTSTPITTDRCVASAATSGNSWTETMCEVTSSSAGTSNTLADVAEYYYKTDLRTRDLNNCTGAIVPPAAAGNTLCATPVDGVDSYNNVPASGNDSASWQHMATFTVGLGARGKMVFSPTYLSDKEGDYKSVEKGLLASSTVCTWQTPGTTCNWPSPAADATENIDDLWHAAVNGRGTYFSASDPVTLASGLSSALSGVKVRTGGTAAATTSSPNIVAGDNFVFSSNYTSGEWSGQLVRFTLVPETLAFSTADSWEARSLLDNRAYSTRKILTYDPLASGRLKSFEWARLSTEEQKFFAHSHISSLSQLCSEGSTCLPTWQALHSYNVNDEYRNGNVWYRVTTAYTSGATFGSTDTSHTSVIIDGVAVGAAGENLVNFLRGDRSNEGAAVSANKYFRQRAHILGDIVNSEAVYVKKPRYDYVDTGYAQYKIDKASRAGMVYVAANDGMLHAFKADDTAIPSGEGPGEEVWAYIPSHVLPDLYKLADKDYSNNHRYFVDGTPTQGDVYFNGEWHTILVGGLNAGGKGYYALDVTEPDSPKALWEFTYDTNKGTGYVTDENLGYSFGKPIIVKMKDGKWVVVVTSGYNGADGQGYLYVLDAQTGAKIGDPMRTGVGTPDAPSGLAQISPWIENPSKDYTATRIYGGDELGNLWRFDFDDNIAAGNNVHLMATLKSSASNLAAPQPITSKPMLGRVNGYPIIFIGTGRFLGENDKIDGNVQSIYAIKDSLSAAGFGNPRDDLASTLNPTGFVKQTLTIGECPANVDSSICKPGSIVRTGTNYPVDFSTHKGWFLDLPEQGERANTDPQLALGTLAVNTNVPTASACTAGGYSFAYFLDFRNGGPLVGTSSVVAEKLGNGLASRPVIVAGKNGTVKTINQVDGTNENNNEDGNSFVWPTIRDFKYNSQGGATKRVSWRELTD